MYLIGGTWVQIPSSPVPIKFCQFPAICWFPSICRFRSIFSRGPGKRGEWKARKWKARGEGKWRLNLNIWLQVVPFVFKQLIFFRLAPIGALLSQMNRTYNKIYINKFLPPPGFEPRFLGTVSRWLITMLWCPTTIEIVKIHVCKSRVQRKRLWQPAGLNWKKLFCVYS